MKRVRIFANASHMLVENKVNDFLKMAGELGFSVTDIQFSATTANELDFYSCMVCYTVQKEE